MPRKKKAAKKTRTRRRPSFPPLKDVEAQKQLESLERSSLQFLKAVESTTVVPIGYMRNVFSNLTADFRRNLKGRRIDPVVRKQERIKAKIAKLQEELANTEK